MTTVKRVKSSVYNISFLDPKTKKLWQSIPRGQRSRTVEQALLAYHDDQRYVKAINYFRIREIMREELQRLKKELEHESTTAQLKKSEFPLLESMLKKKY